MLVLGMMHLHGVFYMCVFLRSLPLHEKKEEQEQEQEEEIKRHDVSCMYNQNLLIFVCSCLLSAFPFRWKCMHCNLTILLRVTISKTSQN